MQFLDFFLDPLYRAPVVGSMLMCLSSSLVGTLMVVKRRSLLGEALSHAAYPGVVLSVILGAALFSPSHPLAILVVLGGAFLFSYLGLLFIEKLKKSFRVHLDAALCLVLSLFLGVGVVFASRIQFTHPLWHQQSQVFIYGQAATMNDSHILIYGLFSILVSLFILFKFRQIEVALFDPSYASCRGLKMDRITQGISLLLILSIVVGIRSVGVILMSGMLLAPAAAARAYTDRLSRLLMLSALFGMLSGFGGNFLALKLSASGINYPTGPMILLVAVSISLFSLLFAPKKGAVFRFIRSARFKRRCQLENILKTFWKGGVEKPLSQKGILKWNPMGRLSMTRALFTLKREGWITSIGKGKLLLTPDGIRRAEHLVRLHRLWELYLVSCLKVDQERVHHSAEEMEHILTPDLEERLTSLLNHPKEDPHQKPIPQGERS
jgi:manganese/zinc/iron transport system permease protein